MVFTREDGDFHGRAVSFREGIFGVKIKNPWKPSKDVYFFGIFGLVLLVWMVEPGIPGYRNREPVT